MKTDIVVIGAGAGRLAAGIDANSIYGDSYVFVLPGNTMGFAFNTGRMAAENAVAYIKYFNKG